jgi:hypothetical protein
MGADICLPCWRYQQNARCSYFVTHCYRLFDHPKWLPSQHESYKMLHVVVALLIFELCLNILFINFFIMNYIFFMIYFIIKES